MANELPADAGPSGRALSPEPEGQQWAIQRRIEDVFTKLGEKFGDLSGRVVVTIKPDTPFEHIGGISQAKTAIRGFTTALTEPDLYLKWGSTRPGASSSTARAGPARPCSRARSPPAREPSSTTSR